MENEKLMALMTELATALAPVATSAHMTEVETANFAQRINDIVGRVYVAGVEHGAEIGARGAVQKLGLRLTSASAT